jgi:hypothetical protein
MGGLELDLHSFLLSALEGSEWFASRPGSFIPGRGSPCLLNGEDG